jgi:hypothetical protein
MKALFWIGMVALVLGIVSLIVPVPRSERHEEKVPPFVSAVIILGGAGMMFAGKTKS